MKQVKDCESCGGKEEKKRIPRGYHKGVPRQFKKIVIKEAFWDFGSCDGKGQFLRVFGTIPNEDRLVRAGLVKGNMRNWMKCARYMAGRSRYTGDMWSARRIRDGVLKVLRTYRCGKEKGKLSRWHNDFNWNEFYIRRNALKLLGESAINHWGSAQMFCPDYFHWDICFVIMDF